MGPIKAQELLENEANIYEPTEDQVEAFDSEFGSSLKNLAAQMNSIISFINEQNDDHTYLDHEDVITIDVIKKYIEAYCEPEHGFKEIDSEVKVIQTIAELGGDIVSFSELDNTWTAPRVKMDETNRKTTNFTFSTSQFHASLNIRHYQKVSVYFGGEIIEKGNSDPETILKIYLLPHPVLEA